VEVDAAIQDTGAHQHERPRVATFSVAHGRLFYTKLLQLVHD